MAVHRALWAALVWFALLPAPSPAQDAPASPAATPGVAPGYVLVAPLTSTTTYLVDRDRRVVNTWNSEYPPGMAAYLLENGHLLRSGTLGPMGNSVFVWGGSGGVVEEFDWDGHAVWRFQYSSDKHLLHHDITRMPNGNVLMLAWELKTADEARAAGRDPRLIGPMGMWPVHVIEVKPTLPEGGEIVWEWHLWDHLVQDTDPALPNYAPVASRPERVNINPPDWVGGLTDDQRAQLETLGYLGGKTSAPGQALGPGMQQAHPDWNHANGISYHPSLDQVVLSVLGQNELWVIDHSTTSAEAAGSTGGRYGKGGDLLYRWGNPRMHGATAGEQTLFAQHDVHWIAEGLPGAGHVLVFNNGRGRPNGDYSSVDEFALPLLDDGSYGRDASGQFAPATLTWSYAAPDRQSFNSPFISGAQRLADGNTLVCSGSNGKVFEVTPGGQVVWELVLPSRAPMPFGFGTDFLKGLFDKLDTNKDNQLSREEFGKMPMPGMPPMGMPFGPPPGFGFGGPPPGPGAFGPPPGPGAFGPPPGPGGPAGPGGSAPSGAVGAPAGFGAFPGPGGPPQGPMPGFGPGMGMGMPGFGMPPMGPRGWVNGPDNGLFKAPFYPADYPAFRGRQLRPGRALEEVLSHQGAPASGGQPG